MMNASATSVASRRTSLRLRPARRAFGSVPMPGSKSISNRVLLLAALTEGSTLIERVLDSDDTRVMLDALRTLGISVQTVDENRHSVRIEGQVPFPNLAASLFLGNAGTAFRPLTAVLAVMGGRFTLEGVPRMYERPIGDLVDALRSMGCRINYLGKTGYPPLNILPAFALQLGEPIRVNGSVSSQFLSALLLAAPLATATMRREMVVEVVGELISRPYIEITLNLMERFGVRVERVDDNRFVIPANSRYRSPGRFAVEGDASSASYFMALGAIGGGPVRVTGVGAQSIQGDVTFAHTLEAMGAHVSWGEDWIETSGVRVADGARLRAFDADFNLIPDAAMTAAVLALYADAPCRLRNIGSWRVKETDRISAMATELRKLGAIVEEGEDWLKVTPVANLIPNAEIETYDDHRMAMCFSLATFGGVPVRILDPKCTAKTFPTYFDVFKDVVK